MADSPQRPPRTELASGLEIPRILTGLWQVADMERGGAKLDAERASIALGEYAADGFDAFDMADHYGSAEEIAGRFLAGAGKGRARAFTKWCPEPGAMTPDVVTCRPSDTVREIMALITVRRIRHIPVCEGERLLGIVSIGDVLKSRLDEKELELNMLRDLSLARV